MRKEALVILLAICLVIASDADGQSVVFEPMFGTRNYYYQHTVSKPLHEQSRLGFFHTSSLHYMYAGESKDELMSQAYLTYSLFHHVRLAGGLFYATKPGFSPSLAAQFTIRHERLRGVVVPRVDLKRNGSFEVMMAFEYIVPVTRVLEFYSRAQFMSNADRVDHNRSYQYLRAGLRKNSVAFGIALNIDERGGEIQTQRNYGVFVRYDLK